MKKNKENETNFSSSQFIPSKTGGARGHINLTVPKRYSEMSFEQTKYVCLLLSGNETEEAIWTKCFIRFAGINPFCSYPSISL
ncbi:MAG: hypothetical protein ACOYMD_15730 [Paludibacter sp.]